MAVVVVVVLSVVAFAAAVAVGVAACEAGSRVVAWVAARDVDRTAVRYGLSTADTRALLDESFATDPVFRIRLRAAYDRRTARRG